MSTGFSVSSGAGGAGGAGASWGCSGAVSWVIVDMPPPARTAPGMTAASSRPAFVTASARLPGSSSVNALPRPCNASAPRVESFLTRGMLPTCSARACTGPSSHSVKPSHPAAAMIFAPRTLSASITPTSSILPNEKALRAAELAAYAPERNSASSGMTSLSSSSCRKGRPSIAPPTAPATNALPPVPMAARIGGTMETAALRPPSIM